MRQTQGTTRRGVYMEWKPTGRCQVMHKRATEQEEEEAWPRSREEEEEQDNGRSRTEDTTSPSRGRASCRYVHHLSSVNAKGARCRIMAKKCAYVVPGSMICCSPCDRHDASILATRIELNRSRPPTWKRRNKAL